MGDVWAGIPPQYSDSYPGQLSLLPLAGLKICTRQSAVMSYGWGSKADGSFQFVNKRMNSS